jgi:hypothetical protein
MKNEIALKEKTMTTKELAEVLGVSKNRVQESAKRIFPNRMIHGHATYWNEYEVSEISKELKRNQRAPNLTVGLNQQLPSTQLEVLERAGSALKDLMTVIADMKAEADVAKSKAVAFESENKMLKHQVEYNEVIGCSRWRDVKKLLGLKITWEEVCEKLHLEEEVDYFKKCMGFDKYPTIMIPDSTIERIKTELKA